MDESEARDRELQRDYHAAYSELFEFLTHPDRAKEDMQQQRFELVRRVAPYIEAVSAAREGGLTVEIHGNGASTWS